jgi:hypothetical protein
MINLITTAEHAYAVAAAELVTIAKWVRGIVLPALVKVEGNAQTVETLTALVSPAAANIERAAFAVLGKIIKSIEDAGTAADAGGVNVSLDAALVADLKSIIPAIKAQAAGSTPAVKPAG